MSVSPHASSGSLPRLLSDVPAEGAMSFDEHLSVHGPLPAVGGDPRAAADLIEEIRLSGLGGRGGAGFPTAVKLDAVARSRGRAVVVLNAAEGEPASRKDRVLMRSLPQLLLDGGILAAEALGSDELIVCACDRDDLGLVATALATRRYPGRRGDHVRVRFELVPHSFLSGEETALVRSLNGGPALPTFAPPRPGERGVQGRPTLVCNAETLAHVAMIARGGGAWFRQLGTEREPGSALVTLSGPVARPGVYEIERGAALVSLLEVAGGTTAQLRAALIGGYGGTWIGAEAFDDLRLCSEDLAPHGAALGAGVIALLDADACPVAETRRLVAWLAHESSGQCGPCVNGLHASSDTLGRLVSGCAHADDSGELLRLMSLTRFRGACRHPDGVVQMLDSALAVFAEELADHSMHGPCYACQARPRLPLPAATPPARPGRRGAPARQGRRGSSSARGRRDEDERRVPA